MQAQDVTNTPSTSSPLVNVHPARLSHLPAETITEILSYLRDSYEGPIWQRTHDLRALVSFSGLCRWVRQNVTSYLASRRWLLAQVNTIRQQSGLPTVASSCQDQEFNLTAGVSALMAVARSPANPYSWLNSVRFTAIPSRGRRQLSPLPTFKVLFSLGFPWGATQRIGGKSPLDLAAEEGDTSLILQLLSAGVKGRSDYAPVNSETLIHWAASEGHLSLVQKLLEERGATTCDAKGWTALHAAAEHDQVEVARLLIGAAVAIDPRDSTGATPLHLASKRGKTETTRLLLEHKADPNAQDRVGVTPLILAVVAEAQAGRYRENAPGDSALSLLMKDERTNVRLATREGVTALHQAVSLDLPSSVVTKLLERGAGINALTTQGETALVFSAQRVYQNRSQTRRPQSGTTPFNAFRVFDLLVQRKANLNIGDASGNTPLHWLVMGGPRLQKQIDLLLGSGADINIQNLEGLTPLHLAVPAKNRLSTANLAFFTNLLAKGADLTIGDREGNTAIHRFFSLPFGSQALPRLDLSRFPPRLKNLAGQDLVHAAAKGGSIALYNTAKGLGATGDPDHLGRTILHSAARASSVSLINTMVVAQPGLLKKQCNRGRTPLHDAAEAGSVPAVQALIQRGADHLSLDKNGQLPLHLAAIKGHTATVELLLKQSPLSPYGVHKGCSDRSYLHPGDYAAIRRCVATLNAILQAEEDVLPGGGSHPMHAKGTVCFHLLLPMKAQINVLQRINEETLTKSLEWGPLQQAIFHNDQSRFTEVTAELEKVLGENEVSFLEDADVYGFRPLHLAALLGHVELLRKMLEQGADASARNAAGITLLKPYEGGTNFRMPNPRFVKPQPKATTSNQEKGKTAQHPHPRVPVARYFGQRWSLLKLKLGVTPLMCAADAGYVECVRALLKAEADVQMADYRGWNALHFAVSRGYVEIVQVLLEAGCPLKAGPGKITARQLAVEAGQNEIVALFDKRGSVFSPFYGNLFATVGSMPATFASLVSQPATGGNLFVTGPIQGAGDDIWAPRKKGGKGKEPV